MKLKKEEEHIKGVWTPFPHLLNIRHLMGVLLTNFFLFPVEFKWYVGEITALLHVKEYSTWNKGEAMYQYQKCE